MMQQALRFHKHIADLSSDCSQFLCQKEVLKANIKRKMYHTFCVIYCETKMSLLRVLSPFDFQL